MWTWIGYVALAFAVFWLWMFFGSRYHCPRCGRDLTEQPLNPMHGPSRARSCTCGWCEHEDPDERG